MDNKTLQQTNFAFLKVHSDQLVRLGILAKKYSLDDPNTSLLKMCQFDKLLARQTTVKVERVWLLPHTNQMSFRK